MHRVILGSPLNRLASLRRLVAVALLVVAGCHRGERKPASCGTVGQTFIQIATSELESSGTDAATRRDLQAQLPAMRDSLVSACTDGSWSATVRTCQATATTHAAFQACQQQLSDDQRRALAKNDSW